MAIMTLNNTVAIKSHYAKRNSKSYTAKYIPLKRNLIRKLQFNSFVQKAKHSAVLYTINTSRQLF